MAAQVQAPAMPLPGHVTRYNVAHGHVSCLSPVADCRNVACSYVWSLVTFMVTRDTCADARAYTTGNVGHAHIL